MSTCLHCYKSYHAHVGSPPKCLWGPTYFASFNCVYCSRGPAGGPHVSPMVYTQHHEATLYLHQGCFDSLVSRNRIPTERRTPEYMIPWVLGEEPKP